MEDRERRYYHNLYEIAAAINSTRAPQSVLFTLVERVAKALEAKGCSLMLLTPDTKLLLHTAAYGLSDWYIKKGPLSADKSISEALEGKPVAVLDATTDERIQYREQAKREGIASILSIPIMFGLETIGVMRVYTEEPRQFSNEDIFFAGAVANLGAIALEKARLYDSIQKDYHAFRRDMLEWRAALGHEWLAQESVVPSQE